MEAVAVWRSLGAWAGGRAVLYAAEDGDLAVAYGDSDWRGYFYADLGVVTPRTFRVKYSIYMGYGWTCLCGFAQSLWIRGFCVSVVRKVLILF